MEPIAQRRLPGVRTPRLHYRSYPSPLKVALIVVGDPLSATTHSDLIVRCHERGIGYKVRLETATHAPISVSPESLPLPDP